MNQPKPRRFNRLEIIDHTKTNDDVVRAYLKWISYNFEVTESIQDEGRTLKIFLANVEATEVGAKPTVGRTKDLSVASQMIGSTPEQLEVQEGMYRDLFKAHNQDNNFEQELDKLIQMSTEWMDYQVGEGKKKFEAQKAKVKSSLEEAVRLGRIDELRGVTKITGKYASKAKALDEVWNRCMKRLATLNKDQEKQ